MDVGLGWLGVGVGAVGSVVTFLLARASAERDERAADGRFRGALLGAGLALIVTLVFWAISTRTRAPFSTGQTLGWGFLIGGALGALAILAMPRFDALGSGESTRTRCLLACSASFFALFGASLTYGIFHGYPQDALIGFAIGAVMSLVLARAVFASDVYVGIWAIFAVLIAAGTVLAVLHFDDNTQRMWWALSILLATTACVTGYVGIEIGSVGQLRTRPGASFVLSALVGSVLLLTLSAIYAWRVADDWQFLAVVGAGVVIAAVIAWLAAGAARVENVARGMETSAASAVLVVALAVVAFKLWGGLGIALALIGAWSVLLPAMGLARAGRSESDAGQVVPRSLILAAVAGLAIVLFRLFIQRYRGDLGTTDLRIHYMFIGALLGYIAPMLLGSWPLRFGTRLKVSALVGLLAAASPLVLFVVWGIKAAMGFMFGLIIVAFARLSHLPQWASEVPPRVDDEQRPNPGSCWSTSVVIGSLDHTPPLLLGAQLVAIQFVGPLMTIEDTRVLRIWVVGAVVLLGIAWLVVTALIDRRDTQ
jgi:hypothetical protein